MHSMSLAEQSGNVNCPKDHRRASSYLQTSTRRTYH